MPSDLQARYDALRQEMIEQIRRTAALEGHWLFYTLLAWEFCGAYVLNHFCVYVWEVGSRPLLMVIKIAQFAIAVAMYFAIVGRKRLPRTPFERWNRDLWLIFILLCAYVEILNILADHKLYTMLPAVPALAAFAFSMLTRMFSKKFMLAGNFFVIVGVLMVLFPEYALLIYGSGWLVVLQTVGVWYLRDRKRWLDGATSPGGAGSYNQQHL
jgi:hypothetical protein